MHSRIPKSKCYYRPRPPLLIAKTGWRQFNSILLIDTPTTVSEEISSQYKASVDLETSLKSVAIQTIVGLPLRLRVFPSVKDIIDEDNNKSMDGKKSSRIWKHIRFLGRLSLSLFGKNNLILSVPSLLTIC